MEHLRTHIAGAIRREREARGIGAAELSRRSGVSKATISQLEAGTANPTVETLWAIGDALGVPFSALVDSATDTPTLIRAGSLGAVPSAAAPYTATLLSASPPGARRDMYLLQAEPGRPHLSAPHVTGTREHVLLTAGAALVGPADQPIALLPGDFLTYRGDVAHVFEATATATTAVLISDVR